MSMNFTSEQEKDYYDLLVDMLDDGVVDESERNILNKRKEKYQISNERAKEIEDFAKQEYLESKTPQFETDGEKDYYDLLVDMLDDGVIDESERNILNKRKEKYGISDERAKELENFAKSLNTQEQGKPIKIKKKVIKKVIIKEKEEKEDDDLFEQGKSDYENEEYDKAIEIFKKAVELNPDDYLNWYWLGRSYNDNEQYQEAINSGLKATQLNPDYAGNWFELGGAYRDNKQYQNAINSYLKATQLNPNDDEYFVSLGWVYYDMELYKDAMQSFIEALKLNASNSNAYYGIGKIFMESSQYDKAKDAIKKAIELNPNISFYSDTLNFLYYLNEEYEEFIKYSEKSIENGNFDENRYGDLGYAYSIFEDYDNAVISYEKYIEFRNLIKFKISSYVWNNYGVALANLGRIEEARNAYANAVRIDPDSEIARDNLNNIGYSRGGSNNSGIVSGISSTIDAVNEVYKKVDPEVVKGVVDIVKYFLK